MNRYQKVETAIHQMMKETGWHFADAHLPGKYNYEQSSQALERLQVLRSMVADPVIMMGLSGMLPMPRDDEEARHTQALLTACIEIEAALRAPGQAPVDHGPRGQDSREYQMGVANALAVLRNVVVAAGGQLKK